MVALRGLIASGLLASALASPHLISTEVSGPKIEKTHGLGGDAIHRDPHIFPRSPGAPMVRRNGLVARSGFHKVSFEQTLENQVIFNSTNIPLFPGPSLAVVCAKCCTKGGVEATYPDDITDVVNPKFRVDLQDIEVYIELDVIVSDKNKFEIPLLSFLPNLKNLELGGSRAGLFIDLLLVFEISGKADLHGGFYLKIPNGSFFEIDISEDAKTSQEFTDVISKALPVTINNGETGIEFKAALQLKAEFGITAGNGGKGKSDISLPGIGGIDIPLVDIKDVSAGAAVGAFVNLIEYVAKVSPEDDCALEATHGLNLNMGVFAKVGVSFEDEFLGLRPSATTTLLTLPLPSSCLLGTGLPVPTRETPLPTAGECGAKETPSAKDDKDEEGNDDDTKTTAKDNQDKSTTAPRPTAAPNSQEKRDEPKVKELTAVACASALADCPENLKTTITYKTTLCDAPEKTGSCFAVTDAEKMEPTSVVNTEAPAKANTSPPKSTGEAKPEVSSPVTVPSPESTAQAEPQEAANSEEKGTGSMLVGGSTMALVVAGFAAVLLL